MRPRRAVNEQRRRIDLGHHFGEARLGDRVGRQRRAEKLARPRASGRLVQRAAGEAECRRADRRSEEIERRHRIGKAAPPLTDQGISIDATAPKTEPRQRTIGKERWRARVCPEVLISVVDRTRTKKKKTKQT